MLRLIVLFTCVLSVSLSGQTFTHTDFSTVTSLTTNNSAAVAGTTMRITPATSAQRGSFYETLPLNVVAGFDTTFTFQIASPGGGGADGMTFVIHNDPRGASALGINGGQLGYSASPGTPTGTAIANSLVVEIDTWAGNGYPNGDLSANEISIHTNGTGDNTADEGLSIGRVSPVINMSDGLTHMMRVRYVPGTLDVFLDNLTVPILTVPYDFTTGGNFTLSGNPVGGLSLVGNTQAYVGFTAATGGSFETHDIVDWTWSSPTVSDDVAVTAIEAPVNDTIDCLPRSNAETVRMQVRNLGSNPIASGSLLLVAFQVDSNVPVSESLTLGATLNPGDSLPYTFTATADLSALGSHTVTCSVIYGLDLDPTNDSRSVQVGSGGTLRVTTFPYSEDFDSQTGNTTIPPFGWAQETMDATGTNADWIFRGGSTPTSATGPTGDHTSGGGSYAYVEDDGTHAMVELRSPCLDLSGLINPALRYFIHSNDSNSSSGNSNQIDIDVVTYPSGTIVSGITPSVGHVGTDWQLQVVDLSAYAGQVVQLIFRASSNASTGATHDIAIDDVRVVDAVPTLGQAPQPGFASFNVNSSAMNGNSDPISFGFGGPYFHTLTVGGLAAFQFDGPANQPFILFAGSLNVNAAVFPNIGSIDCGGPNDPMTGIPTLLTVLGDGSAFGGINPFFVTAADGHCDIGFSVPAFPPGVISTFQCAFILPNAPGIAISNAIVLDV